MKKIELTYYAELMKMLGERGKKYFWMRKEVLSVTQVLLKHDPDKMLLAQAFTEISVSLLYDFFKEDLCFGNQGGRNRAAEVMSLVTNAQLMTIKNQELQETLEKQILDKPKTKRKNK